MAGRAARPAQRRPKVGGLRASQLASQALYVRPGVSMRWSLERPGQSRAESSGMAVQASVDGRAEQTQARRSRPPRSIMLCQHDLIRSLSRAPAEPARAARRPPPISPARPLAAALPRQPSLPLAARQAESKVLASSVMPASSSRSSRSAGLGAWRGRRPAAAMTSSSAQGRSAPCRPSTMMSSALATAAGRDEGSGHG